MQFRFELEGGNFSKAGYASSQIKKVLKQLSVDPRIIKRVVVALYEAEVNVVAHAWRGTVLADIEADRISLLLQDEGPGIPDHQVDVLSVLALALQRRFDLFRQVFAQKISDSFNDHRCSFLRCLYGGFHALRGPVLSPDGYG